MTAIGWFLIARNIPRANISQAYEPMSQTEHHKHQQRKFRLAPEARVWLEMAAEEAAGAGIRLGDVLAGHGTKSASAARWRAWRRILDSNPRYSIAGLARISGYDHTTILHGLKRLAGHGPKEIRAGIGIASGRYPK